MAGRRRATLLAAALGLSAALATAQPAAAATITLEVTGIDAAKGTVRASLYRSDGWLEDSGVVVTATALAAVPSVTLSFPDMPPGTYAIALVHDEDDDGGMTDTLLGFPAEGFGFSNNVRPTISAPAFDEAAFTLGDAPVRLQVALIRL
jgi:uncharacterized protein (DUF2141 family)